MKVVTGANGHVGNNLVRLLLKKSEPVRALINRNDTSLSDLMVERVKGNLLDYNSLVKAFDGADIVYHCAARISIMPGQYDELYKVNVEGTENVIRACKASGVRRLVYVSSVEAIGDANPGGFVNETHGFNPGKAMLEYGVTKAKATLKVEAAIKSGFDAVIVCPVGIIGPNDHRPSQMGKMFMDFINGKLPAYPGGGFDFVDVRDVAEGIYIAGERGKRGESYLLTSEHIKIPELMKLLQEITGKKKPFFKVPHPIIYTSAYFAEKYYKLVKTEPVFTRDSIRILRSNLRVDGMKAKRELGLNPRSLKESITDQINWFISTGKTE